MVKNDPQRERETLRLVKPESKYTINLNARIHAALHGRLSPGSDEIVSLIMMKVEPSGEGISEVVELMFSMQFSSLTPGQRDPEVLDIMPYQDSDFTPAGSWQLEGEDPNHPDRESNRIVGTISLQGRESGPKNTATWKASGSAVRLDFSPAVLLRHDGLENFQASCLIKMQKRQKFEKAFSRSLVGEEPVLFDHAISRPIQTPSTVLDNLQEFMRSASPSTAKPRDIY